MSVNVFRLTLVSVILAIDKESLQNVRFCFPSPECLYWNPLKPSALQQVFFSRLLLKLLDTVVALWSYKSFDQEKKHCRLVSTNNKCMATVSGATSQGGYLYPPATDRVDRVQTFIDQSQSVFRESVEEE